MTTAARPTPPAVGKAVSVRIDAHLYDDLLVLLRASTNLSDAIKWAVGIGADLCTQAWEHGGYPTGATPQITGYQLQPYDTHAGPSDTQPQED